MPNILELEYNTSRAKMIIPEYGRNVQKMINHCCTIEDKEERNKCANAIIKVMGQLNPQLRDIEDFTHKLWAHLFIMSDFQLDVDSPYPRPSAENFTSKPEKLDYPNRKIKYGHYGKILEDMIKAAVDYPEGDEKNYLVKRCANLLKASYLIWNRDTVNDNTIVKHLEDFSGGKLTIDPEELTDTNEILKGMDISGKKNNRNNNKSRSNNRRNKNKNKNNNNNKRR